MYSKGGPMEKFQKNKNPYTLQFSYIPPKYIERIEITNEIIGNFTRDVPTYRGMFITGVRGSGKTVMLSDIRNKIGERKEWITIDLNPESNLLDSLAHMLYQNKQLKTLFIKAKVDLSALGIGVSLEKSDYIASNEEDALRMMLQILKKHKKKLLVTIDEVTYSKDVAKFSHALSSYASQDLDVFVLMTGLKENIDNIKNKKSLTFLYRAKIYILETLNFVAMGFDYEKTLKLDSEQAKILSGKTKGYSLAFQAIGYICWNEKSESGEISLEDLDKELDKILFELSYGKIWDELSSKDRQILIAMEVLSLKSGKDAIRVDDVRKKVNMTSDSFTTYRKRLIDSGIIDGKTYGYLKFNLPRFDRFIVCNEDLRDATEQDRESIQLLIDYENMPKDQKKRLLAYVEKLKSVTKK